MIRPSRKTRTLIDSEFTLWGIAIDRAIDIAVEIRTLDKDNVVDPLFGKLSLREWFTAVSSHFSEGTLLMLHMLKRHLGACLIIY
ncbi:hypothetical protein ACE103_08985 [Bradyrhizobium sp. ma5]|uniref:hypothetical protein n=1 Tax=Bradyrhizobium sp. ma5 TaxID=3344828 RepID=UPI0035D468BD